MAAYFGDGTGDMYKYKLNCIGNEMSLVDCTPILATDAICDHEEDVGIICTGY